MPPESKPLFQILTLFPEAFTSFMSTSIIGRALEAKKFKIEIFDIRDFTTDKHRKVDDVPYGGGAGMVMSCQPLFDCIEHVQALGDEPAEIIFFSPHGEIFNQSLAERYAEKLQNDVSPPFSKGEYRGISCIQKNPSSVLPLKKGDTEGSSNTAPLIKGGATNLPEKQEAGGLKDKKSKILNQVQDDGNSTFQILNSKFSKKQSQRIILLCGHYEGIDQRVIDTLVDTQISMGKFVLTGGELPAQIFIDAVARLLPGTIGKEASHQEESFSEALDGKLEYPHYTRPADFRGLKVPEILLSGHHAKIEDWRREQCR